MSISQAQQDLLDAELNPKDQVISQDQRLMLDALPVVPISDLGNGSMNDGYSMQEGLASSAAQGFTFGFADEIQAFAKSLADKDVDYKTARNEIRGKLAQFRDQHGAEALAAEMAGAVIPSVVAVFGGPPGWTAALANITRMGKTGLTFLKSFGQAKTAKNTADAGVTSKSIMNLTGRSAGGGAVYGLGASDEETISGMGTDMMQTALTSAVLSPIIALGGKGIAKLVTKQGGKNKIDKQVRGELTRLVTETGLTEDEVVMAVMRGELMTENQSLLFAIKTLIRGNPKARNELLDEIELRPLETRKDLITSMQQSIGRDDFSKNLLVAYKQSDDKFKAKERIAYDKVLVKNNKELSSGMQEELLIALRAFDGGADTIRKLYKLAKVGKKNPFYKEVDGEMVMTRTPTIADAEIIYRAIRNEKDRLFRSGDSEIAPALNEVMKQLKAALNKESPKLAKVREKAYQLRQSREAYKYGLKLKNKTPEEVEAFLLDLNEQGDVPAAMQSLRDGFLIQLKGSDKATISREMADGNKNLFDLVGKIFPEESLDEIFTRANTANKAQIAQGKIPIGSGSPSIPLAQAAITATRASSGKDVALSVISPLAKNLTERGVDEKTALGVVQIVTSRNPELVQKALIDDNAMTMLQKLINDFFTMGSRVAGDTVGKVSGQRNTENRNYAEGLLEFAGQMTGNVIQGQ